VRVHVDPQLPDPGFQLAFARLVQLLLMVIGCVLVILGAFVCPGWPSVGTVSTGVSIEFALLRVSLRDRRVNNCAVIIVLDGESPESGK
jgi:hypothetical protein